jgi:hypothetical protein
MISISNNASLRAFTAPELIVLLGGLAMLTTILPALGKAKAKANRIKCVNNLGSIGKAHLGFAQDNRERHPWQLTEAGLRNHGGRDANREDAAPKNWNLNIERIWTCVAMRSELQTPKILVSPCDPAAQVSNELIQQNWRNYSPSGPKLPRQGLSYALHLGAQTMRPATVVAMTRNFDGDDAKPYTSPIGFNRFGNPLANPGEPPQSVTHIVPFGRSMQTGSPNARFIGADKTSNTRTMAGVMDGQGQLVMSDGSARQSTMGEGWSSLANMLRGHRNSRGGHTRGEAYEGLTRPRQ